MSDGVETPPFSSPRGRNLCTPRLPLILPKALSTSIGLDSIISPFSLVRFVFAIFFNSFKRRLMYIRLILRHKISSEPLLHPCATSLTFLYERYCILQNDLPVLILKIHSSPHCHIRYAHESRICIFGVFSESLSAFCIFTCAEDNLFQLPF